MSDHRPVYNIDPALDDLAQIWRTHMREVLERIEAALRLDERAARNILKAELETLRRWEKPRG